MDAAADAEMETPEAQAFPTVWLLGKPIHKATERQVIALILSRLRTGKGGWVATHNLDHLRRLTRDADFAALCDTAAIRTADGKPLIWAASLKGTPLPERVAGSDIVLSLTEACAAEGWGIFLLGGSEGTAEKAAAELVRRYPGTRIAGTYCPPMGFENDPVQKERIETALRSSNARVVYVAVGSPKQERLIGNLTHKFPQAWFLGVGISLAFVTGEVKRAPGWMRGAGLEWTHRLWQEPGRLGKRYLVDGVPFAFKLLAFSAYERFFGGGG